ncbi:MULTISPECIES: BF3164 family lipoprotein [Polaribacter]|nr:MULTISPECIES: BF3164 family lipoprotein [Polaribacter]AUC21956.1 hypothetical protein BTO15_07510 [Polaribacter sejongensis]
MKIRTMIIMLICIQQFSSCKENNINKLKLNKDTQYFNEFPLEYNIIFKNLVDYKIGIPRRILLIDSTLIFFNIPKKSQYIFSNYSLNTGILGDGYLQKGNGPHEVISAASGGVLGNSLWVYDATSNKILTTNKNKAIAHNTFSNPNVKKLNENYYKIDFIDSLKFVGIRSKLSPTSSKFENLNLTSSKSTNSYGKYVNVSKKIKLETISDIYTSTIFSKPTGDKVVLGYRYSDLIEIYDLKSEKCISIQGPQKFDVNYTQEKNQNFFYMGKSKTTQKSFINGAVTNKYIYLIFSGHQRKNRSEADRKKWTYGKQVYVYDWDGNPIKKITLDRYIYTLGISDDDSTIYSYDIETGFIIESKIN